MHPNPVTSKMCSILLYFFDSKCFSLSPFFQLKNMFLSDAYIELHTNYQTNGFLHDMEFFVTNVLFLCCLCCFSFCYLFLFYLKFFFSSPSCRFRFRFAFHLLWSISLKTVWLCCSAVVYDDFQDKCYFPICQNKATTIRRKKNHTHRYTSPIFTQLMSGARSHIHFCVDRFESVEHIYIYAYLCVCMRTIVAGIGYNC